MHGIRERDDRYPVVARINDDTRVIECRAGIQWILQRRAGVGWHDIGYHLDRDVLIERSGATGSALATLQRLPQRHMGGTGADVSDNQAAAVARLHESEAA
jgi:hypothetical protein